jgi:hypothetical protein
MSYISVDFDESYRCADVLRSLSLKLRELTGALNAEEPRRAKLESFCEELDRLAEDLYGATRDYEIADARDFGKQFTEHQTVSIEPDSNTVDALLAEIRAKADRCAEDVPGEISVRNTLYFRMKDAAEKARLLRQEMPA